MRRLLIASLLLQICTTAVGQEKSTLDKPAKFVQITDVKRLGLIQIPGFFDSKKDSIVAQIGQEEFEKVKVFSNSRTWPRPMRYYRKWDSLQTQQWYDRIARLKTQPIAQFNHVYNGRDWGTYLILKISYFANKSWHEEARWDNIYFIINKEFTKAVNDD